MIFGGSDAAIEKKRIRRAALFAFCLLVYLFSVLWYTVLKRGTGFRGAQLELFWSYKRWFAGDADLGKIIIANVAMFFPFGFLLTGLLSGTSRKVRATVVTLAAGILSLTIEVLQLFLMRGLFEWDDVISNTAGAVMGLLLYCVLEELLKNNKIFRILTLTAGIAFVIVCAGVLYTGKGDASAEADNASRTVCFQIDEAILDGKELQMEGFAFRYGHPEGTPSLFLRSTETGDEVTLAVTHGLEREDVNEYFLCEYDYSHTGFTASGMIDPNTEYEIMIRWPWSIQTSSGVFITGDDVHYAENTSFIAPDAKGTDMEEIVSKGILRVYRPDYHCWVYQLGGDLYWIVDSDFNFEEDGSTYIQYQMWTTQTRNLPEKRLAHGNLWDNIGGYFEKYELEGDFGAYRVMKRKLPTAYSLTSIITGYYKNGEWIWKNYFRPIYRFGE